MPSDPGSLIDRLLKLGYIGPDDLKEMRKRSVETGVPLLEAALQADRLHPDARGRILSEALGIPFIDVDPAAVPAGLADLLPEAMAREKQIAPVSCEGGRLTVAVADPFLHKTFAAIEEMTGRTLRLVICPARTIAGILDRIYPAGPDLGPSGPGEGEICRDEAQEWLSAGGPKRVCEKILVHAASRGMTSLWMSPAGRDIAFEGRIGGKVVRLLSFPLRSRDRLLDALRELVGGPPGDAFPSETVFHFESDAGVLAFQASFLQGLSGPEAVVKILPDLRSGIPLEAVGFAPEQLEIAKKVLHKGSGVFLVSSPGREGGATTLFAMLRELYRQDRRVVTVEERHRFRNEGFVQIERRQAEERFPGGWHRLAEALEPDLLMIEHLPDPASLVDLFHVAQSGATVLCGIRRFNFDRALRTLLTLEVDPFLLAHVMRLLSHQRLVNLLCMECRRPVPAKPSLRLVGGRHRVELEKLVQEASFFLPSGCPKCRGTGYSGRVALIDLLPFTPGVQNIVASEAPLEEKLSGLIEEDFYSADRSVYELLRRGMVTYEDVVPFFR